MKEIILKWAEAIVRKFKPRSGEAWTCPRCRHNISAKANYCPIDGTKRQEKTNDQV